MVATFLFTGAEICSYTPVASRFCMISSQSKTDKKSTTLSFDEFKRSLGPLANRYSDVEIEKQRIIADKMADLFFDVWLKKINSGKMIKK